MKNKEVNIMKNLINSINAIDNMADLNVVIDVIKSKQKSLRASKAAVAKASFTVGDTVNIDSKKGNLVGVITKINRTRAICDINGSSYNVPFSIMAVAS
tara:strand:+ start:255 stop:551 length:297 start_codon:yes stop_codon:yes gene_type:complete